MKTVRLVAGLSFVVLAARPAFAQTLDPTFTPPAMYAPGTVYSVLEQPDGKRVATGVFARINNTTVTSRLVRFNPDGSLDTPFLQRVGAAPTILRMRQQSNGQFLLVSLGDAATVGGVTRQDLLRMNADGSADATFDAGTGPYYLGRDYYLNDALTLPGGQVVAVGMFDQFSGVAAGSIVRLSSTGAIDAPFNAGTGADSEIATVVALPSGKLLIGGSFTSFNGNACPSLARLNANGSFDPTFTPPASLIYTDNILLQPDGKILIGGHNSTGGGLMRLNADGTADATFNAPFDVNPGSYLGDPIQLQADGKIVAMTNTTGSPAIVRLNTNGSLDGSYQPTSTQSTSVNSISLTSSGQLLAAGSFSDFTGASDRTLVQLTSTGAINTAFLPKIQTNGTVLAMAQQPNGEYVVGGTFSEINGQEVRRLARFKTDGSLDATFSNAAGEFGSVIDLVLQPDGKVLTTSNYQVHRYQPGGTLDNSFTRGTFGATPTRLLLQPDGKVLVGGVTRYNNQSVGGLLRLTASGTLDNTFAPVLSGTNAISQFHSMALQPDGKVLVGAYARTSSTTSNSRVLRLTSTGTTDPTFSSLPLSFGGSITAAARANVLMVQPDGKVVLAGYIGAVGGINRSNVARLATDGSVDPGFIPPTITGNLFALALQPNGRLLVGGAFTGTGLPGNLMRLDTDGTADASFGSSAMPNSQVRSILVQTDGAIMLGGIFTSVGGQPAMALARLTAPNVLRATLPQAVADRTTAWPVPAHTTLQVALDPAARALSLELLDVLGRPVRQQALHGTAEATVAVDNLPAGQYLLRVNYAAGTVTRRVSVQ